MIDARIVLRPVTMDAFIRPTEIIDWQHPDVLQLAKSLADSAATGSDAEKR